MVVLFAVVVKHAIVIHVDAVLDVVNFLVIAVVNAIQINLIVVATLSMELDLQMN